jgi:hypothetical protein
VVIFILLPNLLIRALILKWRLLVDWTAELLVWAAIFFIVKLILFWVTEFIVWSEKRFSFLAATKFRYFSKTNSACRAYRGLKYELFLEDPFLLLPLEIDNIERIQRF